MVGKLCIFDRNLSIFVKGTNSNFPVAALMWSFTLVACWILHRITLNPQDVEFYSDASDHCLQGARLLPARWACASCYIKYFPNYLDHATMLHQVFASNQVQVQYFFYWSSLSGSNLPHAAITEALSPALKLDKAAESKVGISFCMNHASSHLNNKCATMLCLIVWCPVSAHYHFRCSLPSIFHIIRDALLAWACHARGWSSLPLGQLIETGMTWGEPFIKW